MDTVKSAKEILTEAFEQIKDEHGLALKHVHFDLYDASRGFIKSYGIMSIEFEAVLVDAKK